MATVKRLTAKKKAGHNPFDWENNDDYPEKRGVCEHCNHRDDLKLSFDRIRFICKNAHACVLRWSKARQDSES